MRRPRPIPTLIMSAWIVMAGLLIKREYFTPEVQWRPGSARPDTSVVEWWTGVYMNGQKVGYAFTQRTSEADTLFRIISTQLYRITALGFPQVINMRGEVTLNPDYSLRSFIIAFNTDDASSSLTAPGRAEGMFGTNMELQGGVDGRRLRLEVKQGRDTEGREHYFPVDGPIFLETGPDMLLSEGGFTVGESVTVPVFDPLTMRMTSGEIKVAALDTIEVRGESIPAYRLESRQMGITTYLWVNSEGEEIKGQIPLGIATLETYRETYEQAVGEGWEESTTLDIVNLAAVPARVMKIEGAREVDSMSVRLRGIDLSEFDMTFGRQEQIEEIIEVKVEDVGKLLDYELPSTNLALRRYLQPTPYVQSDSRSIRWRLRRIQNESDRAVGLAERLVHWVYDYLDKVPTAGIPSAEEVLDRGEGDCNEHTVLYTALARAAGIPTQMNAGVVYLDGKFYYHAWPSVWLGQWVAVDPTFDQFPADATHISFVRGGLDRQVELMKIIGRVRIDVVNYFPVPGGGTP